MSNKAEHQKLCFKKFLSVVKNVLEVRKVPSCDSLYPNNAVTGAYSHNTHAMSGYVTCPGVDMTYYQQQASIRLDNWYWECPSW